MRYPERVSRVLVASVRTLHEEQALASWVKANLGVEAEFARSASVCGQVRNGYANPLQLGVDRWLAVLAGYGQIQSACVIVSAGTALTVDLVAHDGRHLGGYIAPGIGLFMAALSRAAARINLDGSEKHLDLAPGDTTAKAVAHACAAMIQGVIGNALQQIMNVDGREQIALLLTGGDADRLRDLYPWASYKQELVLDGLSYAFGLQSIK
jgi:type III pantothenate kinase